MFMVSVRPLSHGCNWEVAKHSRSHRRTKEFRKEKRSTLLSLYSRFSPDVTAAMLVYRTIRKKVFWEFDSIIMQNLSDILPLFCTPTWLSHHVSQNQELLNTEGKREFIPSKPEEAIDYLVS